MDNLIEYSDDYLDISRSLWQFKRDKPPPDNADLGVVNNSLNSQSFKFKAALVAKNILIQLGYFNPIILIKTQKQLLH